MPPNLDYTFLHLAQFLVALVAEFGETLGGLEQLFGLLWEGLGERVVAHLAHQEALELAPVWLLAVQMESVLAFFFLGGIEVPQVPVSALNGHLLLVLGATHTDLDAVVDTWSVADDE